MSAGDFLIGFAIGSLATALASVYAFMKAYTKVMRDQRGKQNAPTN